MKNYSIFLLLLISTINLNAQDYQISFAGTGASTTVDSVKVENLTQGKSITIGGSETLHLVKTITGINPSLDYENTFHIYPNPMADAARTLALSEYTWKKRATKILGKLYVGNNN